MKESFVAHFVVDLTMLLVEKESTQEAEEVKKTFTESEGKLHIFSKEGTSCF